MGRWRVRISSKLKKLKLIPTATMQVTIIVRVGGIPSPKTGATYYLAQLGLLGKGPAIKGSYYAYNYP